MFSKVGGFGPKIPDNDNNVEFVSRPGKEDCETAAKLKAGLANIQTSLDVKETKDQIKARLANLEKEDEARAAKIAALQAKIAAKKAAAENKNMA